MANLPIRFAPYLLVLYATEVADETIEIVEWTTDLPNYAIASSAPHTANPGL